MFSQAFKFLEQNYLSKSFLFTLILHIYISDFYSSRLLRERDESVERRTEFQQSNINEGRT